MQSFQFPDAHEARLPVLTGLEPAHVAQFYEKDDFLATAVVDFLAAGLAAGQAVITIAGPAHSEAFSDGLAERGLDVARLVAGGRLTMADAHDVLSKVTDGGIPDAARFKTIVGGLVSASRARVSHACVRA